MIGRALGFRRLSILGMTLGAVAGGFAMSTLLAHPTLPMPGGSFSVGVTHLSVTHTGTRKDGQPLTRQIAVEVWYPTEPQAGGSPVQYRPTGTSLRFSRKPNDRPNARENAPFVTGTASYPLLLYIPSWSGQRTENVVLLSSLASHGYVVAAMDYPDGEVIRPDVSDLPTPADLAAPMEFSSEAAYRHTLERAELRVRSQAKDAIFVMEQLKAMTGENGSAIFFGRLDPAAVGIIGYSFGGAVAFQAAWLDPRIRAVVNMDGWMFGDAASSGCPTPRLYMSDDSGLPAPSDTQSKDAATRFSAELNLGDDLRSRDQLARYGGYRLQIAGTRHINFCDRPLHAPFPRLSGAGPIDPARAALIIGRFTTAFFDETLKEQPAQLLSEGQADFPEAKLEVWRQPVARPLAMRPQ